MKYSEMKRRLRDAGYQFDRYCRGSHEYWRKGQHRILVTRSGLNDKRAQLNWLHQIVV